MCIQIVFSDWGQHMLPRQLFSEEFEFLVSNMDVIIRYLLSFNFICHFVKLSYDLRSMGGTGDPELVGEFLQCLKLLGIDEWSDSDTWLGAPSVFFSFF